MRKFYLLSILITSFFLFGRTPLNIDPLIVYSILAISILCLFQADALSYYILPKNQQSLARIIAATMWLTSIFLFFRVSNPWGLNENELISTKLFLIYLPVVLVLRLHYVVHFLLIFFLLGVMPFLLMGKYLTSIEIFAGIAYLLLVLGMVHMALTSRSKLYPLKPPS